MEKDAGKAAEFYDSAYVAAGAQIVTAKEALGQKVVMKVVKVNSLKSHLLIISSSCFASSNKNKSGTLESVCDKFVVIP